MFPIRNDKGFSLPEVMVCMPICMILITALVTAYGVLSKNYIKTVSQWAYLEELRIITDTVQQKVRYADSLSVADHHKLLLSSQDYKRSERDTFQFYLSSNNKGIFLLNGQPVSNDDSTRYVNIKDISFQKVLPHKVIMMVTLENNVTGRVVTVENSIYSRCVWAKERAGESGADDAG